MQNTLRSLAMFAVVLIAYCQLRAASVPSEDEMPTQTFDDRLSTNWYAAVIAAVPARYRANTNFNVAEATNYICQESRQGNAVAQALWGFALVVQSNSPEASATGLQLLRGSAEKGCIVAMLNLGYLLEGGKYVRKNYNEAFHWFNQAAAAGNAEAELNWAAATTTAWERIRIFQWRQNIFGFRPTKPILWP
jgi:TPR repeat protein